MGRDKAFLEIDGIPLWQRQLGILRQLHPNEIFIAGPSRREWSDACDEVLSDTQLDAGPLAGLLSAFRRCTTPYLVALAIDLPRMTADFLAELQADCESEKGVVPIMNERYEPLAAIYPIGAEAIVEEHMQAGRLSLQDFVRACGEEQLVREKPLPPSMQSLFLNLNTPNELSKLR